jgi:hypothetical protein
MNVICVFENANNDIGIVKPLVITDEPVIER